MDDFWKKKEFFSSFRDVIDDKFVNLFFQKAGPDKLLSENRKV